MKMYKKINIFTDGACLSNPGPGGYSIIMQYKGKKKIFFSGYKMTTNNRMELMAAVFAIEKLKDPCNIFFFTDSQYLKLGVTNWLDMWKKNNWKNSKKKVVKNIDLWKRLDIAIKPHIFNWKWIKSHSGHPENEFCDKLAKFAANNPIFDDFGYNPN